VPVSSRRAVLDQLLDGKVRPEVKSLVHQAVTVVPAAEVTASFHWLAAQVAIAAVRPAATAAEPFDEEVLVAWAPATGCPATPPPSSRR